MDVVHLTQKQLAARWHLSEATLERRRSEGLGPKFLKLCGQGPREDPPQPARSSRLPARCRRKPTVDPNDRHPQYSASRD